MNYQVKTPILFFIFIRPEESLRTFEQIKAVKPRHLLIAADGARENKKGENEIVQKTRKVILDKIDWGCKVSTNFSNKNLGCKNRLSSGIDWGFSLEEELIILEDDCLPNLSFFKFCDLMLEKFRDDKNIAMISGNNLIDCQHIKADYIVSKYASIWGWASWKRAWQGYTKDLEDWKSKMDKIQDLSFFEKIMFSSLLQDIKAGKFDTWDYQWDFHRFQQNAKSIVPRDNYISNIGYSINSTHTTDVDSEYANQETRESNFPLNNEPNVSVNKWYEQKYFEKLIKLNFSHTFKTTIKYFLRSLGFYR